jgi:hypothetical protein
VKPDERIDAICSFLDHQFKDFEPFMQQWAADHITPPVEARCAELRGRTITQPPSELRLLGPND